MSSTTATDTDRAPAQIRRDFNDAINAWRASIGGTPEAGACARAILDALESHAWLHDQIPFDILGICHRTATPKAVLG